MGKIEKSRVFAPNEDGEDVLQHFETAADMVIETEDLKFLSKSEKEFLKEKEKILLEEDVINTYTSFDTKKPASADAVRRLKNQVNNITFAVIRDGETEPAKSKPGELIFLIDLRKSTPE